MKFATTALAITGLAAAGYSAAWFYQADLIEKKAPELLKEHASAVQYDTLSISGFPLAFNIEVTNPVLGIDAEIIAAAQAGLKDGLPVEKGKGQSIALGESMTMTLDFFQQSFAITLSAFETSQEAGTKQAWQLSLPEGMQASTEFNERVKLAWFDPEIIVTSEENSLPFKHFEASAGAIKLTNTHTGQDAINAGASSVSFSLASKDHGEAGTSIDVDFDVVFEQFYSDPILTSYGLNGDDASVKAIAQHPYVKAYKALGAMDVVTRGSVSFPDPDVARLSGGMPAEALMASPVGISFAIDELTVRADDFDIQSSFIIDTIKTSKRAYMRIASEYGPKYDELMSHYGNFTADFFMNDPMLGMLISSVTDDTDVLGEAITLALPAFSKFGKSVTEFDLRLEEDPNTGMPTKATLETLTLQNELFGLLGKGEVSALQQSGSLELTCIDCDALLESLFLYAKDLNKAAALINPQYSLPIVDAMLPSMQQFIRSIGKEQEDGSLLITIESKGGVGNTTISGQPFGMIMMQAMQQFAPYMQPQAPAAPAAQ